MTANSRDEALDLATLSADAREGLEERIVRAVRDHVHRQSVASPTVRLASAIDRLRWGVLAAATLLIVIFTAGLASGLLLTRTSQPSSATVRSDFFEAVITDLDVDEAKRAELRAILERRTRLTDETMRTAVERLEAMVDSTTRELRGVLDPALRAHFDRLVERQRTRQPMRRRAPGQGRP